MTHLGFTRRGLLGGAAALSVAGSGGFARRAFAAAAPLGCLKDKRTVWVLGPVPNMANWEAAIATVVGIAPHEIMTIRLPPPPKGAPTTPSV